MRKIQWFLVSMIGMFFTLSTFAAAPARPQLVLKPPVLHLNAKAWVLMNYESGQIVTSYQAGTHLPPASLTKLMAAYVVLTVVQQGAIQLTDQVVVSDHAAKTIGSRMFLKAHEKVSVENLLKGMIVQSGNDATVALAEHVAGSESAFIDMMNAAADKLGMQDTHFASVNGLPSPGQYVSAHDMAMLSRALIAHFPAEYRWYSQKTFAWNGIRQRSRNRLLWTYPGTDGLKTGYTKAARYCLVASAKQNHMRWIGVILGAPSDKLRAQEMQKLLDYGFRYYENHTLYDADQVMEHVPIVQGEANTVPVGIEQRLVVTVPKGHYGDVKASLMIDKATKAPIKKGQVLGHIRVTLAGKLLAKRAVVALQPVQKSISLWQSIKDMF